MIPLMAIDNQAIMYNSWAPYRATLRYIYLP